MKRVALVTGGTRGIGFGVAAALAREGFDLCVCGMREETAAGEALAAQDAEDYAGNAETLLILTQQHNMKEENVLYPMCDQHLAGETAGIVKRLSAALHSAK